MSHAFINHIINHAGSKNWSRIRYYKDENKNEAGDCERILNYTWSYIFSYSTVTS